jgi:hypothetical protein
MEGTTPLRSFLHMVGAVLYPELVTCIAAGKVAIGYGAIQKTAEWRPAFADIKIKTRSAGKVVRTSSIRPWNQVNAAALPAMAPLKVCSRISSTCKMVPLNWPPRFR